jgi:hypothetical protein
MKWSREEDYLGHQEKSASAPSNAGLAARFAAALKSALHSIAKPTPTPSILREGNRRGFSTLGTRGDLDRRPDLPFPAAPANSNQAPRP